ncbi:MAG TPA: outer membrane beta-barrel protein [Puia sp.]
MKKIYFTTILLVLVMAGFSQTEKGSWLLGGNMEFTSTSAKQNGSATTSSSLFTLNPMIGYFPVRNFAVILNTNYATATYKVEGQTESSSAHSLTIGPLVRYYFPGSEALKFFVGTGIGFGSGNDMTSTVYQFQAGPAIFLRPGVALELNVNYQSANVKNTDYMGDKYTTTESQFGFGIGFMVYLNQRKK